MLARIARFSEIEENINEPDSEPLRMDELLSLISMADSYGYSIASASDLKLPQDEISSELYAAWYAKENEVYIFADNIIHLIKLTGWERSGPPVSPLRCYNMKPCPQV